MTKEELFYYKLKHDRRWYFEKFLKIRDKKGQLIPFKVNAAQQIVLDIIDKLEKEGKPKRLIILKARQMGMSTLTEAIIFHDTVTNPFRNSFIIAHEDKATSNLFAMSKLFYEELPEVIRPMKKYSNERALVFENPTSDENEKQKNPGLRSKYTVATAGTVEVARSLTIHNVHASELAFYPDAKRTMIGMMQAVPDEPNTLVVLESTANGVGDYFHELWLKASRGENEFVPIFLPWFIDPTYSRPFRTEAEKQQFLEEISVVSKDSNGREIRTYEYELMQKFNLTLEQLNWRKWTIANKCQGDEALFMQEYPSTPEEAFISSGRPKFSIKALKKYQTLTKEPQRGYLHANQEGKIEFIPDAKGYVSIWQMPEPEKFYCIGADVAEGLAIGDYSCAVVGDSDTFDVVAMWHGHIDPDLFGMELIKLAKFYNDAYLGVENNNHGLTTLSTIKRNEYWNIYYTKIYDRITESMTQKIGWSTTSRTKPLMIDKLAEFVREMYLGIYSDLIVSEMFTYIIEDNGKTNAQAGCYDDTVIACAIMLQLLLEGKGEYYTPEVPIDQRSRVRSEVIDPLFESKKEEKEEFSE